MGNVFAKPCRTNIHLLYANMHKSKFILIIKMRQLREATDSSAGESAASYTSLIINSNIVLDETEEKWERAGFPVAGTQCESKGDKRFFYSL